MSKAPELKKGTPCRHCGSPARMNPCWGDYTPGGADPPCYLDVYDERHYPPETRFGLWRLIGGFLTFTGLVTVAYFAIRAIP